MEEINVLQREGWNASFIAGPNFGCSRLRQRQPAEAATRNTRFYTTEQHVCCCRGWCFRKTASCTYQCNL